MRSIQFHPSLPPFVEDHIRYQDLHSFLFCPVFYHNVRVFTCLPAVTANYGLRNSTTAFLSSPPQTYSGYLEEISKYNVHLNFAEKAWAAWYAYMQNDVLATGIMSFAMHEIVYFGRSLPWIIVDRIPYFRKYKIQNVRCSRHYEMLEIC